MRTVRRRDFLQSGALALGGAFLTSRVSFASTGKSKSRFVFIIMRGALDGLAAVPPYGDADYPGLRRELALKAPGTPGGALPLNGFFGLHPSLGFLHDSYTSHELLIFHAIASPYRDRSHFDGQDVLENGSLQPHALQSGWLNRGLASLQTGNGKDLGVALGQNFPLVMRGPASVTSWSPSKLAALDDDTLERITDLYAGDPLLASRLADALSADAIANASTAGDLADRGEMQRSASKLNMEPQNAAAPPEIAQPSGDISGAAVAQSRRVSIAADSSVRAAENSAGVGGSADAGGSAGAGDMGSTRPNQPLLQRAKSMRYTEVVRAAASFLRRDDGPQVAVFDTTGWDTHANEGSAEGQLAGRLAALDSGLRALKDELGPTWADTAVLLATEFGRTAATNGTRGTDHGTATTAFLLGGAVQGGRVLADWPGLSSRALYQGRDLKPTADLRSLIKGVLSDHLLVSTAALESTVFPSSADARPLKGLFRA